MLHPVRDEGADGFANHEDWCLEYGVRPEWKRGDALIGKSCCGVTVKLKFLAWSELDDRCFIGEDDDGDITDDWSWRDFHTEYGEEYDG